MTPDGRYGIAVVGTGIGRLHAEAAAALTSTRLQAVCSRGPAAGELVSRLGTGYATTRWEDVLADPLVDVVCLAVPPDLHEPMAREAASAGKHLLLEKPLARTLAEADRILQACERARVELHVGHNQRWFGQHAKAQELVREFGGPHLVQGNVHVWGAIGGFRTRLAAAGGGTLIDSGVHRLDLLQWLAGAIDTVSAFTARARQPQMEGEDSAVALLQFASGALGTVSCSWSADGPEREESLRLFCAGGGVVTTDHPARAAWNRAGGSATEETFTIDQAASIRLSLEAFAAALAAGLPAPVTGAEARSALAAALACYASAEQGNPVRVPGPASTDFRRV